MLKTFVSTRRACYVGCITQSIINNLAPLLFLVFSEQFKLTLSEISILILLNFSSQLVIDVIATKFADRIGFRAAMLIGHGSVVLGLVAMAWLPLVLSQPFVGLIGAVVLYAMGGGFIEVVVSPLADAIPSSSRSTAMSFLHSFYSWGQAAVVIIATVFIKVFGADWWFVLPLMFAMVPLGNLFVFSVTPMPANIKADAKMPLSALFRSPVFWVMLVIMVCAGASELIMAQWASLFAERGLGVSKFFGDLLGPCAFAIFMAIGRMAYGIWGKKMPLKALLLASGLLCTVCYLVSSLFPNPLVSLFGCALTGLSVSLLWPGMFAECSKYFPNGGTSTFGVLAIAGDLGCALGPTLTGLVSDSVAANHTIVDWARTIGLDATQVGLRGGILIGTLFPIVLVVFLLLYCNMTRSRSAKKLRVTR